MTRRTYEAEWWYDIMLTTAANRHRRLMASYGCGYPEHVLREGAQRASSIEDKNAAISAASFVLQQWEADAGAWDRFICLPGVI